MALGKRTLKFDWIIMLLWVRLYFLLHSTPKQNNVDDTGKKIRALDPNASTNLQVDGNADTDADPAKDQSYTDD